MVKELNELLTTMSPALDERAFVYVVTSESDRTQGQDAFAIIREKEGTTFILERNRADYADLPYAFVAARITLRVHSDLEAVGLTAAVSRVLAEAGISCNVVAGYFHDHLFVPFRQREQAMACLQDLSRTGL
jgi:hypothetical protein